MAQTIITLPDGSLVYHHSTNTIPRYTSDSDDLTEQNVVRLATALNAVSASLALKSPTTTIADPGASGAIPVTSSGYVDLVSAAAETRTLAAPAFKGQMLLLSMKTRAVGDITLTCATTINATGNNTIVFSAAGQAVLLVAKTNGSNIRWSVVSNDGAALSTV